MFRFIKPILIILVIALAATASLMQFQKTRCDEPLYYSIGEFDERFGVSLDKFKGLLLETEEVWEEPIARQLFSYDPQAAFKINLIYDERQQRTVEEKKLREKITVSDSSYSALELEYTTLNDQYEARLLRHEAEVGYWNSRGGAPREDYNRLRDEQIELAIMANKLRALADRLNELVERHNLTVSTYNQKFNVARIFDQGQYDCQEINIYQF